MSTHEAFMRTALDEAIAARDAGEVPIGALVVKDGVIASKAHNLVESLKDATAHAELIALREACAALKERRLEGCTLYSTLEPCAMCTGAIINSRVERVVFGAYDERFGCCGSAMSLGDGCLGRRVLVVGGVLEEECTEILQAFFTSVRC